MINVLVNGCNGRMGKEVINQMDLYPNMSLSCGVDITDNDLNQFPVYRKIEDINSPVDIIIDFSVPISTLNILEYAVKNKIPIVIATTGFSKEEKEKIKEASEIIPVFQSANMSFDINLMSKMVSELAMLLKDSDIEIIETHHNSKKDAPSGTALLLADSINKSLGNKMNYTFDRHTTNKKREKNEIGFSSIRGGNIVGEHTVKFFSPYETFEITHISYSKTVYADGALKAAEFLLTKPAGFYDMNDLINTKSDLK